jgi:hypothetical protein
MFWRFFLPPMKHWDPTSSPCGIMTEKTMTCTCKMFKVISYSQMYDGLGSFSDTMAVSVFIESKHVSGNSLR